MTPIQIQTLNQVREKVSELAGALVVHKLALKDEQSLVDNTERIVKLLKVAGQTVSPETLTQLAEDEFSFVRKELPREYEKLEKEVNTFVSEWLSQRG